MTKKPDPATVAYDSKKGAERSARIEARIETLGTYKGWAANAEASALRWALARLEFVEAKLASEPRISQARAAAIIEAWLVDGARNHDGRPVLDGLDLDGLGIG